MESYKKNTILEAPKIALAISFIMSGCSDKIFELDPLQDIDASTDIVDSNIQDSENEELAEDIAEKQKDSNSKLCAMLGDNWESIFEANYSYNQPKTNSSDRATLEGVDIEDVIELASEFESADQTFAYIQKTVEPQNIELDAVRICDETEVLEFGPDDFYIRCLTDEMLPGGTTIYPEIDGTFEADRIGISSKTSINWDNPNDTTQGPAIYKDRITQRPDGLTGISSFFICCGDTGERGQSWEIAICKQNK